MSRQVKSADEPSATPPTAESTDSQPSPKVGDTVICTSRLPSPLRPWEHPIWIGTIEEPGTDPSRWNGKYSEAAYCVHSKKVRVRYRGPDSSYEPFIQHDRVDSLIVLSEDEANLAGAPAIRHFLGLVAAHQYERHLRESQATSQPPTEPLEPTDDIDQP